MILTNIFITDMPVYKSFKHWGVCMAYSLINLMNKNVFFHKRQLSLFQYNNVSLNDILNIMIYSMFKTVGHLSLKITPRYFVWLTCFNNILGCNSHESWHIIGWLNIPTQFYISCLPVIYKYNNCWCNPAILHQHDQNICQIRSKSGTSSFH